MQWIFDFQLFLFDFDGLLVDTERLHYQAYREVLRLRGKVLPWSFAIYCAMAHKDASAIREGLYAAFPDLDADWSALYSEKRKMYASFLQEGKVQLMPGVETLLLSLEQKNKRRCVVTHSLLSETQMIRAHLPVLDTIPHWITREQYHLPKPDPECYLTAIERYGEVGDLVIGFEDSLRGLRALEATSVLPVLVCEANHPLLPEALSRGVRHVPRFSCS